MARLGDSGRGGLRRALEGGFRGLLQSLQARPVGLRLAPGLAPLEGWLGQGVAGRGAPGLSLWALTL